MWQSLAADLIVVIHVLFVIFVVAGGFLVLKWQKVAVVHVPAAIWGALIELMGWGCPLTPLEKSLRRAAGGAGYEGGFIQHYLVPLIYPGDITREMQVWIGVLVIAINAALYGWIFWRRRRVKGA